MVDSGIYGAILEFFRDKVQYTLLVSGCWGLERKYLLSMDEEDFYEEIVNYATEKHTASKRKFMDMVQDYIAHTRSAKKDEITGPFRMKDIEWKIENEEGLFVAHAEDRYSVYTLRDEYDEVFLKRMKKL